MRKKTSCKLFDVIHAMNMSEKRYFKLFATKTHLNADVNYLKIFNFLDKQKQYDEEKLIAALQKIGQKTAYLAADKNYLYKLILKSLRSFHAGKSARLILKEKLEYVEILYYKGLEGQCLKILKNAKKLAHQHDLQILLLEIILWERKISGYGQQAERVQQGFEELNHQLSIVSNTQQYAELYYQSILLRRAENKARDPKSIEQFNQLLNHEMLQEEATALSPSAKRYFYDIYANYYYTVDEPAQEYFCNQKILDLLKQDEHYLSENTIEYILVYSRLLRLQRTQEPQKFSVNLEIFRNIPHQLKQKRETTESLVTVLAYGIEMVDLIEKGAFQKAELLISDIAIYLKEKEQHIRTQFIMTAYYRFVYVYIALQKHDKALYYANKIINEFKPVVRLDVYRFTRILQLIIHYELNNSYLLKYLIRSTQIYLKKQNRLYQIESVFLKFMQKSLTFTTAQETKEGLQNLYATIVELTQKNSFESHALLHFDFLTWLDSKLNGVSFVLIKQKKWQNISQNKNL